MAGADGSEEIPHGDASVVDEYAPTFYIGHHESRRPLPVVDSITRQAQEIGYDMLTTPITTPSFHSRVLSLLSNHLSVLDGIPDSSEKNPPPTPIIPPLNAVDTPLTPGDVVTQLIAYTSPWIDICSPDPIVSNISRQVLNMEVAYAAFCGIGNIVIQGPRRFSNNSSDTDGVLQYARVIQEALLVGSYVQIAIHLPMYRREDLHIKELIGDLAPFVREEFEVIDSTLDDGQELFGSWDAWNVIRTICKYNSRLSVALGLPRQLPIEPVQSRWFAEPLRMLTFNTSTFLRNKGGHPVLSKGHQSLITRYMRLKQPPWLLLCDVGPLPAMEELTSMSSTVDSFPSPSLASDTSRSVSPTLAEVAETSKKENSKPRRSIKDQAAHLIYLRYLQKHQPPRSTVERFGSGYQDYLQAPLQPLTDNLESVTYEVFEKDPVKYDWYEEAIAHALNDWAALQKPTSSQIGAVVVAVAGSGRGPLVTRALRASAKTGVQIEAWAVEKNPNAYVVLQRHNEEDWGGVVNIVKSDMRAWKGPLQMRKIPDKDGVPQEPVAFYGKVDILVSELLGSFADNELSPECLDGVQHVLSTPHGISIPSSYTAHMTPILAPKLHAEISHRSITDDRATEIPYVVMLHAIDYLANSVPGHPQIQQAWEFNHPLPAATLAIAEARRAGGVSGGGGGSMAGGDGANEHNARNARLKFVCKDRGVVNGIAGYFEAVLYAGGEGKLVELSTRPDRIEEKSRDMISWFPIYFPLKTPLYFPDDSELEVAMWRQTDDRKVWYEWVVEAFAVVGPNRRMRVGMSEVGSSRKNGCLM